MARIFISHSSVNNAEALALRDWLVARGWDDLFLDIDPHRGLVSGQRWLDRLQESSQRCKAVLFALVIDDTAVSEVSAEMRGVWQLAFFTRGSRPKTSWSCRRPTMPPPRCASRTRG